MLKLLSHGVLQLELNQEYILGHTLVPRFVFPVYLSYYQLGVTLYDDLSEDTEIVRSILAMIASYSTSLLDEGKFNRIAYSILSPIGALSCKPTPTPIFREAPSTLRIHQPAFPRSTSYWGISTKKSANIGPFITKRDLYWIPN